MCISPHEHLEEREEGEEVKRKGRRREACDAAS